MSATPTTISTCYASQVKLRLRKRNKNITLENIDKYNKNKLLKLFSDCYIDIEILEVYPGGLDEYGQPDVPSEWIEWRDSHPDDIPNNFRNLIYNLIINGIYPKLRCLYNNGSTKTSIISLLSNFTVAKLSNGNAVILEYISRDLINGPSIQEIRITLTPFGNSNVKLYNI